MRRYATTLFRLFTIALVAGVATGLLADCPQTMDAEERGWIAPNGPWIVAQCPDACGNKERPPVFLRWEQDYTHLDTIVIWCPGISGGPGYEDGIPSTGTCWNCMEGCAGTNCEDGELCVPRPNQMYSDCIRYGCNDPAYTVVENPQTGIPYCLRKDPCPPEPPQCTSATVAIGGPATIRPGATCTWSAVAYADCDPATYTYNWHIGYHWVGSGQYYTGGRPSGVAAGQPWRLRVDVTHNGQWVGTRELEVRESSTARLCVN